MHIQMYKRTESETEYLPQNVRNGSVYISHIQRKKNAESLY
jgi:hypothetical protein